MANFLLTLVTIIVICASASAQKLSLAANNGLQPGNAAPSIQDTINAKPLLAVAKPKLTETKNTEAASKDESPDKEMKLLEETAQLRLQGRQDAKTYYKPRAVFWGTMGTTILYPAAGLATGTIVAVVPPSPNDEDNPNAHLMKEPAYEEAYKKQAHRKRFGNAAAGFGIGVAVLGIVSKIIVGEL